MRKPKFIFGEDNGYCSLWDITKEEYESYRERLNNITDDDEFDKVEKEWLRHEIRLNDFEHECGYVPGYVGYLAEVFNIEVDSN